MAKHLTLGKHERLKSRKAIEQLFKEGKKFTVNQFRVFYTIENTKCLLLGAGVSTKNFSRAVDRNRIKRLIREAWRLQKNSLLEILEREGKGMHVFIICTSREMPDFSLVKESAGQVIQKLLKLSEH